MGDIFDKAQEQGLIQQSGATPAASTPGKPAGDIFDQAQEHGLISGISPTTAGPSVITQFEQDRSPGADTGVFEGMKSAASSLVPDLKGMGSRIQQTIQENPDLLSNPIGAGMQALGGVVKEGYRRATTAPEGYGLGYKVARGMSTLVPGLNPESMENRAAHGDTGGILGEAAVPLMATGTTMAVAHGLPKAYGAVKNTLMDRSSSMADAALQTAEHEGAYVPPKSAYAAALQRRGELPPLPPFVEESGSTRARMGSAIDDHFNMASQQYKELDRVTGTDIRELEKRLGNDTYQRSLTGGTPADLRKAARLDASIASTNQQIADANAAAQKAGLDPQQIKGDWQKANALNDFQTKVLKNQNVVSGNNMQGEPEKINVKAAIKECQKLMDTEKYGGNRLAQAFGEDNANNLMNELRKADAQGTKALEYRKLLKWAAAGLGSGYSAYKGMELMTSH